ncbi:Polynucleotide adenylyltransferase region [Thermocrinis albus DSM 14484]|uniref:Polynucleotide adenylyltransferase region n=1 Tax=Thermocrinis albus (strain DSM 14484 / JCM 11386 / HI 11/12) TaxID=638303 RepID=D3SLB4_THEAH|nr:CBS domain-containing protein [Thermocrinis albus]ADC89544.1 Polynucleotide adenylyltransferase region [Thermocrinis albus DSM 14484]
MKLVILEEGADLDALSSAYGVLLLYPDAYLLKPTSLSQKASLVFKEKRDKFRVVESLPERFQLILVDTHHVEEILQSIGPDKVEEVWVYDHHPTEKIYPGEIQPVGSTTTLIVEEILRKGVQITPEDATLLALGIYEDTGNLTYEGTTYRDAMALAWLLQKGASLREIRRYTQEFLSREHLEILYKNLHSVEHLFIGDKKVSVLLLKGEEYTPGIVPLVYRLEDIRDSSAFFVLVEAGSRVYLLGRSIKGDLDVSHVLEKFGGGGHSFAGAVKLEDISAERMKALLVSILKGEWVPLRVRDIMSTPPFVLHKDTPIQLALAELSERNFAGAPVVDDMGKLVGVIYKKTLLKAVKLFPDKPVSEFMILDFHTLSPDDFVWKTEKILSTFGEKLIPVVEGDNLVGVVTRLDLIHTISRQIDTLKPYQKRLQLPEHLKELAERTGQMCKELGFRCYLVGGVVRDLLLGKRVWDIDFVVEGDAIKLAQRLAQYYNVNLHPFPQFGTVHLKIKDIKVELATTRRETYPHPGAYPVVEPASLKEDLLRRDFTINAMAVSVMEEDFGTLIDYFGGLRDLKEGLIRILHPMSFVEDPVRILRALRFAGRFGFKLSKSTEKALLHAVSGGFLSKAPVGRLMNELRLALREERFIEILYLYKKYGVLQHLLPDIILSQDLLDRLETLRDVVVWHRMEHQQRDNVDYSWLYLILLLSHVSSDTALKILKDINAPSWVHQVYHLWRKDKKRVVQTLKEAQRPSEVYRTLKGFPVAFHLLLMTEQEVSKKILLYLDKLRFVKVSPHEFQGLKGKELGEAIEREKMKIMDQSFKIN